MKKLLLVASLPLALGACSLFDSGRIVENDEYNDDRASRRGGSLGAGATDGILVLGTDRSGRRGAAGGGGGSGDGSGLGVNAYLWRASLDTLSFMPITSADPFGGVILTDWYSPPAARGERFRAQAYILGRELRSDGVRITVFRQEQRGNGWADAPVATATGTELEDRVLSRARELRSVSASR